ncbi:MAG: hypothetical protein ACI4CS_07240 [Candidatus Weimeria sp.]
MAKGYKLFMTKKSRPGELFPLYVFAEKPLPMGVWLDAEEGIKDGRGRVKSRLGSLCFRPGWHINENCPYAVHIYSVHDGKKYQKDGTVWCEVEYSDDIDYQPEADKNGIHPNGKYVGRDAYLKHIPVNGYYRYKTSPQMYGRWIIAGKMKIVRTLTDDEVIRLCHAYDLEPLQRY